jgi:hypothetical protein
MICLLFYLLWRIVNCELFMAIFVFCCLRSRYVIEQYLCMGLT